MSKIEQLLKKLCPNGVEYKKLGEIATIERGNGLQKKDFVPAGVPCIHYGQLYTRFKTFIKSAVTFVDNKTASNLKHLVQGDILMAVTSENVEDVCKCIAWLGDEDVVVGGHTAIIHHKQNPMYLAYWFQTEDFFSQKRKLAHGTKVIDVTPKKLEDVVLPVPPLEIQREVVEVLDKFALLTAELTAELEKRKKQYEHYRDKLLVVADNVEWKLLGEICDVVTDFTAAGSFADIAKNVVYQKSQEYAQLVRTTDLKSNFEKSEQVYVTESAFKYLWRVNLDREGIVLPNVGNCGEVYYVTPEKLPHEHNVLGPNALWVRSSCCNIRYLSYWFGGEDFQKRLRKIVSPVGQSKFNKTELKKLSIPLPSLAEQERIVKILDRFDKLCNDLTSGLPAEIAARKKQYEYYRDKLLSFKRAG